MKKEDYEFIVIDGKDYFQIGCAVCAVTPALWKIACDNNRKTFICQCSKCGHTQILKSDTLRRKPYGEENG